MEVKSVILGGVKLEGNLAIPKDATSIALFTHGSGSSHYSPRNGYVAKVLQQVELATLLIDWLTPSEEEIDLGTSCKQHYWLRYLVWTILIY